MRILSRAGQVLKAYKNAGRVREIVGTMTRFGFGTLVNKIGFRRYAKSKSTHEQFELPVRLRMLCEQLGPTFIKLGQVLAGRPDLVPHEITVELEKLQDQVAPVAFLELKPLLEQELGRPLEMCFSSFDTEALATASIAQVHSARTLDGDDVVVKIKKPGVDRLLKQDLEILEALAHLFERYIPELRPFKPSLIVHEFQKSIYMELDFHREAIHMRRFRQHFNDSQFLVVPQSFSELSSTSVLTMERLRGIKLQNVEKVKAMGVDPGQLMQKGMEVFFQSILIDGLFHGDPHGGNILALPDGRMGLLDFGSMGWLSQKSKDSLINMFLALLSEDYQALVMEYLNLSSASGGNRTSASIAKIESDVTQLFSPFFGLPINEIPLGKLLLEGAHIALKHNIIVPADLILVFKSIMTLEGIGRSLDPNFDLVTAGSKYAKIALKERYSPERLGKDLLILAKNWSSLVHRLPHQLGEIARQAENGELSGRLEVPAIRELARAQRESSSKLALSILASTLFLGCMVTTTLSPALPLWFQTTLYTSTTFLFAWVLIRLLRRPFS